jgi:23S rRNA pseudouridine1911/1915/1917 synthase
MHAMMRERQIHKVYYAWIEGEIPDEQGEWIDHLAHKSHHAEVVCSSPVCPARLTYRRLKSLSGRSLVEILLHTGKYHQIRAQFSHRGYPVVGDGRYGAHSSWDGPGIALHHGCCSFLHPVTQQPIEIRSIPEWAI